ncbi:MAG: hypothetical protein K9K66_09735 [Desulfarculaceae bacterium]|nr:hypothetical protein [Desulfarculaceae bacterium]MCF8073688.1 hypothetical protein [Desulfarculaceae bacterium]MCF8101929.1 hypothetical protein [Desulfarculaceae bacterium]MCF8117648.1 hypothetical protein [Desulfarculaceae bacterium]
MVQPPKDLIKDRPLEEGFDTSRELWDRLVDDIAENGRPCMETVERLVDQACHLPANPDKPEKDQA